MNKKIAVLGNGWYNKGLMDIYRGMKKYAESRGIDLYFFLTYSQFRETKEYNNGEFNIHRLPNFKDFDGVVFVPGSISSMQEVERVRKQLVSDHIPAVSVGMELEGLGFVSCDDYKSMRILCNHILTEHEVGSVAIMAGHRDSDESNMRVKAITDSFSEKGITIDEQNIYYCNWEVSTVKRVTEKFITKKGRLPDIIMCANDYSAMTVCLTLAEAGYSVPEDVLVTGFDNVDTARAFSPSITTLAQPNEKIGYECLELLYEMAETGEVGRRECLCELITGESCGCDDSEQADKARRKLANDSFVQAEDNINFEWVNSNIENTIFKTKKFEELSGVLQNHFQRFHEYEGDGFAVVLEHTYKQNIYSQTAELKSVGFGKSMEVLVGVDDEETFTESSFDPVKLVPRYKDDGRPHTYMFASFHSKNNIFGYIVFRDQMQHMVDRSLYAYVTRMGELFEKYRKTMRLDMVNSELMELSVKDSLTGLYNRLGYENVVKPRFDEIHLLGRKNAILFMDINRMKYINDTFGHMQGDMAIRIVASVISECISNDWMAIRYGGDEFLIIGACDDEQSLQYICERLSSTVAKRGEEMKLPYKLSASAGYMLSTPYDEKSIEEYVSLADEYMYKRKKRTYDEEELNKEQTER